MLRLGYVGPPACYEKGLLTPAAIPAWNFCGMLIAFTAAWCESHISHDPVKLCDDTRRLSQRETMKAHLFDPSSDSRPSLNRASAGPFHDLMNARRGRLGAMSKNAEPDDQKREDRHFDTEAECSCPASTQISHDFMQTDPFFSLEFKPRFAGTASRGVGLTHSLSLSVLSPRQQSHPPCTGAAEHAL